MGGMSAIAAMIKPGFKYGTGTVFAVSYEVDDLLVTKVWLHVMISRPRSTDHVHICFNPTDTVEGTQ